MKKCNQLDTFSYTLKRHLNTRPCERYEQPNCNLKYVLINSAVSFKNTLDDVPDEA